MKKRLAFFVAAVMALGILGGCSSNALETQSVSAIKESGKIVMYTEASFMPWEYTNGDDVMGVDVEIALAIAEELGVELEVKNVKFDTIVAAVQTGKAAFGAAGMTVTDERKESVDFSIEYYTSMQYVITKDGVSYTSLADLAGKKVGVQLGTTGDFLISDAINGWEEDGEHVAGDLEGKGTELKQYASPLEAAQDLINGKIDAVVVDKLPAENIVANNEGIVCEKIADAEPESYGICVAKGNEELLEVINKVLKEMIDEGLIEQYVIAHSAQE